MKRWLRFNAVGIMGTGVQIASLAVMLRWRVNYLVATAIAVELALLHNYAWHRRYTWAGHAGSLWRFHFSNGLISVVSNLLLMRLMKGAMGWPPIPANLVAVTLTSFVNFTFASRWVFAQTRSPGIM